MKTLALLLLFIVAAPNSPAQEPPQKSPAIAKVVSLAQRKADRMAKCRVMRHWGGGFGKGRSEGVGVGSTRDRAIRNCCYWGRRKAIDIGAALNGRRWYACVIYK
jgi:hypothetical protein